MAASIHTSTTYRPEIDGLRALAVLPVVLFHAGLGCLGGFIGVDIFFVISGFLITSIIQKQLLRGDFKISHFWEKRIRRILPALTVVVLCTIAGATFSLYPAHFEDFGKELIAQSTLVSNFYFWQQDGYFAAPSESQAMLHTWSLSVEEQFYFIFPFLLTWFHTRKNNCPNKTLRSILLVLLISLTWSCYGAYKYPTATFFLLPSRAWEMMIGASLALYKPIYQWSHKLNELISWLAILTIGYCIYSYDASTPFPGIAALPPCLAAGALIFCNKNKLTTPAKFLSLRPIVFVGKVSYSFYLWHWPIIVFANYTAIDSLPNGARWGLVGASFVMAILSWRFVETPFRTSSFSRKHVFRAFYISTAIFILCGLIIYKGDGWKHRFPDEILKLALVADEGIEFNRDVDVLTSGELPTIPISAEKSSLRPILLWGDSHACRSIPAFEDLCAEHKAGIYLATKAGVPPVLNTTRSVRPEMEPYNKAVYEFIKRKQIRDVILVCRWAVYSAGDSGAQKAPSLTDCVETSHSARQVFSTRLPETVRRLTDLGARVWILKQVPLQEKNPPQILANAKRFGHTTHQLGIPLEQHMNRQQFVNSIFESVAGENVTILDPTSIFLSKDDTCQISHDGQSLYRDRNHVSCYGAQLLAPLFSPIFK